MHERGAPASGNPRLAATWALVLAPLGVMLVLCCHWEPVLRDGWGHVYWQRTHEMSWRGVWEVVEDNYLHNNPRLGQTVTLLQYTPGPWHAIGTPLLELAMFGLLATLALGRAPSLRRADDAFVFATVTALALACMPAAGQMLFYRPYTGNYLFGFTLAIAFLVPYRVARGGGVGWWRALAMFVLGAVAGACNEHTPPAVAAAALVALIAAWRRPAPRARTLAWMSAGIVGMLVGWGSLLYAPAQAFRYNAIAAHESTYDRLLGRGLGADAGIILRALWDIGFAAPWLALGAIAQRRFGPPVVPRAARIAQRTGLAAAVLIALTLLGSPKEGDRLALAPCLLAATAVASWVAPRLASGWPRRGGLALAVIAIGYIGARCVLALHTVHGEFAARVDLLEAAPPHATVRVPAYRVPRSRWFLGDDFVSPTTRAHVADAFGLAAIELTDPASD